MMRNLLLRSLDHRLAALLAPHLTRQSFGYGTLLGGFGGEVAWFPETLVAAVVEILPGGRRAAIGVIGREGLIGWPALLGDGDGQHADVQLVGGDALAMPMRTLRELADENPGLHRALLRFGQSFIVQMRHSIVSGQRDALERRLARWLTMLHDRVDGDTLTITHQNLAEALNVRRASVTDALHILEGERVLRCTRAMIMVRDRGGLEAAAGPAYGAAEDTYARSVTRFAKRPECHQPMPAMCWA